MKKLLSVLLCVCLIVSFCTVPVLASDGSSSEDETVTILLIVLIPLTVALAVCMILKSQMKTARPQSLAHEYMELDESRLRIKEDIYTHSTRVVRKIPQNNNKR